MKGDLRAAIVLIQPHNINQQTFIIRYYKHHYTITNQHHFSSFSSHKINFHLTTSTTHKYQHNNNKIKMKK